MRRRARTMTGLLITLPLSVLFGLAVGETRAEQGAAGAEHRLVGEVTSVDAPARTFTVKETLKGGTAKSISFELAEGAKVMIRGKESTLDEIKQGDSVTVRYVDKSGRRIAMSCDVAKPAAKKS